MYHHWHNRCGNPYSFGYGIGPGYGLGYGVGVGVGYGLGLGVGYGLGVDTGYNPYLLRNAYGYNDLPIYGNLYRGLY